MPPDDSASEQIEDVMTLFSEMGVNVIENEERGVEPTQKVRRNRLSAGW